MQLRLAKRYNNKIMKAIAEFNLISDGDKIMVALSGGKDSMFLLFALNVLQKHMAINFKISALTIDNGFAAKSDYTPLKSFCKAIDTEYHIYETDILKDLNQKNVSNPCAKCSYLRKGVMAGFCKQKGYNKLALGHHYDDAIETFLISLIYSGQLKTFLPKRFLSKKEIFVIRPLVYLREKDIERFQRNNKLNTINNLCPFAEESKRNKIRENLDFIFSNKQLFYNLAAAIRGNKNIELWPEKKENKELMKEMYKLWGKK